MRTIDECIEVVEEEMNLCYGDDMPETAAALNDALEYLHQLKDLTE